MRQVTHRDLYNFLFPLLLLAASCNLTQGGVTGKLDSTTPSAVVSPDCTTCTACPTPCGGGLPHPPPELPKEEPPKLEPPPVEPSVECPLTGASAGCLPQPYYYTNGNPNPNTLYPYKPYNYEYYNGCEIQVQKLPMIVVLIAMLLSCWY